MTRDRKLNASRLFILAAMVFFALGASPVGSAVAASPAWRVLAATGPTNLPPKQSEIQRLTVEATGGTFTLSQVTATGTGTLSFGSGFGNLTSGSNEVTGLLTFSAFEVGQSISGAGVPVGTTIVSVGSGTLVLSAAAEASGSFVPLTGASKSVSSVSAGTGSFHVGDLIASAALPVGTTVAAVGPASLTLSNFPIAGGVTALTASERTGAIPYSAPATGAGSVEAALEALPAFGDGSVAVSGGPGGEESSPYLIVFGGPFADSDVGPLIPDGIGLSGENKNIEVFTMVPGGAGTGKIVVYPVNVGGAATTGAITLTVGPLPAGIVTTAGTAGEGWTCPNDSGQSTISCARSTPVPGGWAANPVVVPIAVDAVAAAGGFVPVSITGGGATTSTYQAPVTILSQPAQPGFQAFLAGAFDDEGTALAQAGDHPATAFTGFVRNTIRAINGVIVPAGDPRDINAELPPGFIGNPRATPRCPQSLLTYDPLNESPLCTSDSKIGVTQSSTVKLGGGVETGVGISSTANDMPPTGYPAEFSTKFGIPTQSLVGSLRSDEDYGITVTAPNVVSYYKLFAAFVSLEGQPAGSEGKAFFTNPTDCTDSAESNPVVGLNANTWQMPSIFTAVSDEQPPVTGCNQLEFDAYDSETETGQVDFDFQPSTSQAASVSAGTASLHIDQAGLTNPGMLATPHLKKSVVTLPEGLVLNPSAANGLAACSTQQVGLLGTNFPAPNPIRFNKNPVSCPDGSKIGTVEISTPLLDDPLQGTVYLAAQSANPFNSLLAMYLVVDDAKTGTVVKLPGEVKPNPQTGQLTATFDNNPQVPFTDLKLQFRGGGPRSTLATPDVCGKYTTNGSFTPWSAPESGPPAATQDDFSITTGVGGSASCPATKAQRPFTLGFEAGTTNPVAGAHSPFTLRITRPDGNQELSTVSVATPPGFAATLKGVAVCSDAQLAQALARNKPGDGAAEISSPSCPASSQVGTTTIGAGVGSEPFYVKTGKVYRTGAYKGAQQSLTFIVPAVAGPFDLGVQVVRTALRVNPTTAQITAESDPIPQLLQGIPLQIREVRVDIDRPGFTINPTSCAAMSVNGQIGGGSGAVANVSNRFQVGNCGALGFKPNLKLTYKGATKRGGNPALRAVLTQPEGQAGISRTVVILPKGSFIDNDHINNPCTRAQYAANACPKASILGKVTAWSPLLDQPLTGNVYFRSNGGERELPDIVASLKGEVDIELVGFIDAVQNKKAGTSRVRNTFAIVPDAPVSRFELSMKGGKFGLIENSKNLCRQKNRATVKMAAHNGKKRKLEPVVANDCRKKKGKGKK